MTALALQAAIPIPISFSVFNETLYIPSTAEAATEIGMICMSHVVLFFALVYHLKRKTEGKEADYVSSIFNNHLLHLRPNVQHVPRIHGRQIPPLSTTTSTVSSPSQPSFSISPSSTSPYLASGRSALTSFSAAPGTLFTGCCRGCR